MIASIKNNPELTPLWNLYTCREEYHTRWPDKHGRFSSAFSKNTDCLVPHVSKHLFEQGFRPKYPENKPFAVCLTHDIDNLFVPQKESLRESVRSALLLKGSSFRKSTRTLLNRKKNDYYNLEKIIDLEKKAEATSSFYFLSLQPQDPDFNYSLESVTDRFELVKQNGCEIGLHAGHTANANFDKFISEKKYLEKVSGYEIIGNRNHYLKFDIPHSWEILSKAGIRYDTTYGYHNQVGFRNGMCYPYYPYNLESGQFSNVLEIPLVIMEDTLYKYLLLNPEKSLALCKHLVDITKSYNGVLTFLWHNNHPLGLEFYELFLKYCKENNAWMTSCEELYTWWTTERYDKQLL